MDLSGIVQFERVGMGIEINPDDSRQRKTTISADVGNKLIVFASRLSVIMRRRVTYQEATDILDMADDVMLTELVRRYNIANDARENGLRVRHNGKDNGVSR